jgi:hypothetical protein
MIELGIRIKSDNETGQINIGMSPNHIESNAIEKDVLAGLYPHVANLLEQLLSGEGFKKTDEVIAELPPRESQVLNKYGTPASIPMTEEYLVSKGLVEPADGAEIVDRDGNRVG